MTHPEPSDGQSRVGFIGTGHIAAPMARVLARGGHQVSVSERNADVAAGLVAEELGIGAMPNQDVIDTSDIVFLCLRPSIWAEAVAGLRWRADQHIVSVMSGVPLRDIAQVCAPVIHLSATIPYGFIEMGGCPLPVAGDPSAVEMLFGDANPVLPQADEAALIHHFAASALASGVLEMLDVASGWLADQTHDADKAEIYVSSLIAGVLQHMDKSRAGQLAEERDALATPGTLNLQMVKGLAADSAFDGLPALLSRISASMKPEASRA